MPNLAFHLTVLDQVIDKLVAQNDPHGAVMKDNSGFAALGAFGPDLLRYSPISSGLSDALTTLVLSSPAGKISTLPASLLSELFLNPLGAAYALLFRQLVVPNWPVLNSVKHLLDKLDAIAQTESNISAVEAIGDIETVLNQTSGLSGTLAGTVNNLVQVIGQLTELPAWMEQTGAIPVPPADIRANRASEFLRWHNTGAFARNLLSGASTDQQRAYALGWLCHVAAAVAGEPFVNNIAGGPYRTHWWRNNLVRNFVDSWVFGFFETGATMSGDDPTPPYASWKPLCSANLQDRINIGGLTDASADDVPLAVKCVATGNLGGLPGQFPADLADLLAKTVTETYAGAILPIADLSADAFRRAYVGAFAIYWFMTSGSGPMCDNPIGGPPVNCSTPPDWITSGQAPSPQQAGANTGGIICAILLAILALVELLTGNLPGGLAAIIALLNAPVIDWATVRCNLFWLRKQLVDAENALRDALVIGALAYPPPAKLGTLDTNGNTIPALDKTVPTGLPLCRTNAESGELGKSVRYPRQLDVTNQGADLNFDAFPRVAAEEPETENLIPPNLYPNFVVAGAGLQNGGLLTDGPYPSRYEFFGDAVSNALEMIAKEGDGLPDYNLDGDRGYGWKGWHPKAGTVPANPPVIDEQDS